jgi:hypothetical protein
MDSLVVSQDQARGVYDGPRTNPAIGASRYELGIGVGAGSYEAEVLAFSLVGAGKTPCVRFTAHLLLGALSQWEHQAFNVLLRGGVQEVALVFGAIVSLGDERACRSVEHACVVSCSDPWGVEAIGESKELPELDLTIA